MAALGSYDYRDPSLVDYMNFEKELLIVQGRGGTKQEFKIIELDITMPAGATMIAADAGRTNEFDGTGTPIIVYAISSDNTQDKATGTGALEVTIFGTDENDLYLEEAFTLNGTTEVAGSNKFKRLIGAMLTSCGTDGVGTGNVTITDTGQSECYLTIPAGQAGSCNSKCYLPDGYKGILLDLHAGFVQTADAASVLITEGVNIWLRKIGDSTVTEDEIHQYSITNIMDINIPVPHTVPVDGGDDVLFDLFHQSIDTDNTGNVMHYHCIYLVWKEA